MMLLILQFNYGKLLLPCYLRVVVKKAFLSIIISANILISF